MMMMMNLNFMVKLPALFPQFWWLPLDLYVILTSGNQAGMMSASRSRHSWQPQLLVPTPQPQTAPIKLQSSLGDDLCDLQSRTRF